MNKTGKRSFRTHDDELLTHTIKQKFIASGLGLCAFCREFDFCAPLLSMVFRRKRSISFRSAAHICRQLNISMDAIIFRE